jgi:hypothetical protein
MAAEIILFKRRRRLLENLKEMIFRARMLRHTLVVILIYINPTILVEGLRANN